MLPGASRMILNYILHRQAGPFGPSFLHARHARSAHSTPPRQILHRLPTMRPPTSTRQLLLTSAAADHPAQNGH